MIIDFHTHIFPDVLAPKAKAALEAGCNNEYSAVHDMTLHGLVEKMDEWGVDISVIQPVVTKRTQVEKTDEWAMSIASERIIPFAGMFPNADDRKSQIDMIAEMGFKGIKLHPEYQNFVVDEPEMIRMYDYILDKGLILLFHAGYDPAFSSPLKTSPQRFAHIVDELRGGTIVAAHLGGQMQWDDVERYLCGKEIYLDTSMGFKYYPEEQFLRIVKNHGADKLLFGSDSPWSNTFDEIETLKRIAISDKEKELILHENAERILNKAKFE